MLKKETESLPLLLCVSLSRLGSDRITVIQLRFSSPSQGSLTRVVAVVAVSLSQPSQFKSIPIKKYCSDVKGAIAILLSAQQFITHFSTINP